MLTNLGKFANVGFLNVVEDSSRRFCVKMKGVTNPFRNALHFCFSYSRSLVPPSKEGGG